MKFINFTFLVIFMFSCTSVDLVKEKPKLYQTATAYIGDVIYQFEDEQLLKVFALKAVSKDKLAISYKEFFVDGQDYIFRRGFSDDFSLPYKKGEVCTLKGIKFKVVFADDKRVTYILERGMKKGFSK